MRAIILSKGALIISHKGESWLFGAPEGIKESIEAAGLEVPKVLFTTAQRAPGFGHLGPVLRYKEAPLRMNGMSATPIHHNHGTDYMIEVDGSKLLFSERGDVASGDTADYALAIIKNKHRGKDYGANVITWPWPDVEYNVQGDSAALLTEPVNQSIKEYSSMDDVPDNLKSLDDVPLTLAQANKIVEIAQASGDDKENWAIGISTFKKGHEIKDGAWVVKVEKSEKELVNSVGTPGAVHAVKRFGDVITAALHTAYNDIADHYFAEGYLSQDERMEVAHAVGPALTALRDGLSKELMERDITYAIPARLKELAPDVPDNLTDGTWATVYKDDEGADRWASISSVAVWDNHDELFTEKAMDWAITFSKLIGDKGPLRYRHCPGLDGGKCDTQIRVGRFLFESGTFDDTPLGNRMKELYHENPDDWKISVGLAYAKPDLIDGVYQRAWIFERSMTQAPANDLTVFRIKELTDMAANMLTEEQLKAFADELKFDQAEVKLMFERAIQAGKTISTKEELTTTLKESGMGGANATEDDEDEDEEVVTKEDLVAVLSDLTETEWKEFEDALRTVIKAKGGKPDDAEEDDEDYEEDDEMESSTKERLATMERIVLKQAESIDNLVTAIKAGVSRPQEADSTDLVKQITGLFQPRNRSLDASLKEGDATKLTDADILEQFKSLVAKAQAGATQPTLYDAFTSRDLNQPRR